MLMQWISEVVHFCQGLPIVLVGCKVDLRGDPTTIDALKATNQRPVEQQEVSTAAMNLALLPRNLGASWRNEAVHT